MDPFNTASAEVEAALQHTSSIFELCQSEFATRGKSNRQEELETELRQLEVDIDDLSRAIAIAEQRPDKYAVEKDEMIRRKDFVNKSSASVSRMKQLLSNSSRNVKRTQFGNTRNVAVERNEDFLAGHRDQQQALMNNQDGQLAELALCTERLNNTARIINSELHDQQRMLSELDDDVDRQREKMNFVTSRMSKVLQTNSSRQLYCVLGLSLSLVFLLLMVLYI